jgi:uncharacterized MAPEG superfamily protein
METATQLPTEIFVLGLGIVLLVVQLVLHTLATISDHGRGYALGPHDETLRIKSIYGGRITRAFYNLLETFVVFAALALALVVTGKAGGLGAAGAWVWFSARVLYVPAYVVAIPGVRTALWTVSMVGVLMMLVDLFM